MCVSVCTMSAFEDDGQGDPFKFYFGCKQFYEVLLFLEERGLSAKEEE